MREILFRGKRTDNGEWVEGDYHRQKYVWSGDTIHHAIYPIEDSIGYEIDLETRSQYTGLTDKGGRKIWEGDILQFTDADGGKSKYEVRWKLGGWLIYMREGYEVGPDGLDEFFCERAEVIGNIYDNPVRDL